MTPSSSDPSAVLAALPEGWALTVTYTATSVEWWLVTPDRRPIQGRGPITVAALREALRLDIDLDLEVDVLWDDLDEAWSAYACAPDGRTWEWGAGCVPGPDREAAHLQLRAAISTRAPWLGDLLHALPASR